MNLKARGQRIMAVAATLREKHADLIEQIPKILADIIRNDEWREYETPLGHTVTPDSFTAFVETSTPYGLGVSPVVIRRLCELHPDDDDARLVLAALRDDIPALANVGRPTVGNVGNTNISANGAGHVIARLKRDDPELAAQVINGTLTAHAAALKAGIRRPRITIPADNLTAAIARIEAHYGVTIEVHE